MDIRPIDANALELETKRWFVIPDNRKTMREAIEAAPTLDYAPVVHGYWRNCGQISRTQWLHRCSLCGCPQDYAHKFCPNCGAKMDAKEETK